jgi:hypothetical protein
MTVPEMSMPTNQSDGVALRPRDLAMLILASGDLQPRQRARDQQADIAGAELKRRVLTRLLQLDPEPAELAATLDRIVHEIGQPTGPTRAVATIILDEFESAQHSPELVAWLLEQAAAPRRGG